MKEKGICERVRPAPPPDADAAAESEGCMLKRGVTVRGEAWARGRAPAQHGCLTLTWLSRRLTCVCRIASAKQARKTLLHVLGVERTDEELGTSAAGRGGDELWQQRSRALDAPLNATKIEEVCLARACGGCRAQAQARVRLHARVIHAHMHTGIIYMHVYTCLIQTRSCR